MYYYSVYVNGQFGLEIYTRRYTTKTANYNNYLYIFVRMTRHVDNDVNAIEINAQNLRQKIFNHNYFITDTYGAK